MKKRVILSFFFCMLCGVACSEKMVIEIDNLSWYGSGSIKMSYPHGVYHENIEVSMRSENEGIIHYTLDGNTPTLYSPVYNTPLQIETTTVIRAIEEVGGGTFGFMYSDIYLS